MGTSLVFNLRYYDTTGELLLCISADMLFLYSNSLLRDLEFWYAIQLFGQR